MISISAAQKKQRQAARQEALNKPPSNEETIARLESELSATKLHLEAETNGRIAACNQLQIANLRIEQLHADNCKLHSQLQQTQAQLNTFAARGPLPGPLKKLINALPSDVQTALNSIPQLYGNGKRTSLISDLTPQLCMQKSKWPI